MTKTKGKPVVSLTSWWSERRDILASIKKSKPARARPKIKRVTGKAKPKKIKAKKAVKVKKVIKMKKATKGKKGKAKRAK